MNLKSSDDVLWQDIYPTVSSSTQSALWTVAQTAPALHVHVFKCALVSWPVESALTLPPQPHTMRLSCHRHRAFPA